MTFKELAIKAEEEFNFQKAIEYYKKAESELSLKDGSLLRYGNLLYEFQDYEKAKEIFEKIISKNTDEEYLLKLAQIYEELNENQKALEIYEKLNKLEKVKELEDKKSLSKPTSALIRKFMDLFSGRGNVFSIQHEYGYKPVRRPLNYKDVEDHLTGKKTLGIYQLKENDSIKFAVYDVDIKKNFLDSSEFYIYEENAKKVARKLSEQLSSENIKNYIEFTGNRGYHIWFFFDTPILSYKVKTIMEKILDKVELDDGIDVEIFPKQTQLNGGLGNLIKVPLGIHRKTGKKCLFVNGNFEIIPNQSSFLLNIEYNKKDYIESIYKDFSDEEDYYEYNSNSSNKSKSSNNKSKPIKTSIRRKINKNNSQFETLKNGCSIIHQIISKIEKNAYISEEEEEILIKSVINIENGEFYIKKELQKNINFSNKRFEMFVKRSKGVPITCEEIRKIILNKKLSLELENCICKFPSGYNTPYAIIENIEEMFFDKIDINDIAKKIVEKNAEKFEIEKEINNLKSMISKKMGYSIEMRTEIGLIKKKDNGDIEIII